MLSMSDGGVCVHSLPEFERMDRLPDAKSNKSNLFAVDTEVRCRLPFFFFLFRLDLRCYASCV